MLPTIKCNLKLKYCWGLLHLFPNQQWSIVNGQGGRHHIDHSPWNTDQGSLMGCYLLVLFKYYTFV